MKIYFPAQKFMEDVFLSIKKDNDFENPPVKREVFLDKNVVHLVWWRQPNADLYIDDSFCFSFNEINYEPESAYGFMYYFIDNDGQAIERNVPEITEQLRIRTELARREYEVLHNYWDMNLEIEPRGKYYLVKLSYNLPSISRIVASADEVSDDSIIIKDLLLEATIGEILNFSLLSRIDNDEIEEEYSDDYEEDDDDEERYSHRSDDDY